MIQIEIEATEDVLRLVVLQNGHPIGHVEALGRIDLPELAMELSVAAKAVSQQLALYDRGASKASEGEDAGQG